MTREERPRLLYAALQLPWPPDNGQKIVTLNDLALLSEHFDIEVISYVDAVNLSDVGNHLDRLKSRVPRVTFLQPVVHDILRGRLVRDKVRPFVRSLVHQVPFVVSKYSSPHYAQAVVQLLENSRYDVFYFESLGPSFLLPRIQPAIRNRLKVVYRAFDWFSETLTGYFHQLPVGPVKVAVGLDSVICHRYERRLWSRVDIIAPVTARLAQQIKDDTRSVASKIVQLPVVVDVPDNVRPAHCSDPPRVLYIGTIHYPPNLLGLQWFLRECWPRVLQRHPDALLDVVGRGGDHLGTVHSSVKIRNYATDLRSAYESACAFVVPLFAGSGIRLKILDALVHGVPIVTTSAGYLGLDLTPGTDVLVADAPELFAEHVCALLNSHELRQALVANGLDFVKQEHGLNKARQSISTILELLSIQPSRR